MVSFKAEAFEHPRTSFLQIGIASVIAGWFLQVLFHQNAWQHLLGTVIVGIFTTSFMLASHSRRRIAWAVAFQVAAAAGYALSVLVFLTHGDFGLSKAEAAVATVVLVFGTRMAFRARKNVEFDGPIARRRRTPIRQRIRWL